MNLNLDHIRRRVDAATPGPWRLQIDHCDCNDGICSHGSFPFAIALPSHTTSNADTPCDRTDSLDSYRHSASDISALTMETAEFIAHARQDVPALLAEVDRLQAELDRLGRGIYDLTHDTDGGRLGDGENIPVGEVRRILLGDGGAA